MALEGNYQAKIENSNDYNIGLDAFSSFIIQGLIDTVTLDISGNLDGGDGSGILRKC